MNVIKYLTENNTEGHYALKLTALVSLECMEKMSTAQDLFVEKVLQLSYDP
jgi:hypothetical protein